LDDAEKDHEQHGKDENEIHGGISLLSPSGPLGSCIHHKVSLFY
jgi:hypothetical protein